MIQASPIAQRLMAAMKEKGVTITELADDSGIPRGTISSWFSGRTWLDISKPRHRALAESMCRVLDVELKDLVEGEYKDLPAQHPLGGLQLLDILLDVIEDPNTSRDKKTYARRTVHEMVKAVR